MLRQSSFSPLPCSKDSGDMALKCLELKEQIQCGSRFGFAVTDNHTTNISAAKTQPLLTGANAETEFWRKQERVAFIANAVKTVTHPGQGSKENYSVQGAGCDQLMDNSQIDWHQGEVSSIINLLVSTSLGSMFLWSAIFIWRGSASCKTNLGICVRSLSKSFREP